MEEFDLAQLEQARRASYADYTVEQLIDRIIQLEDEVEQSKMADIEEIDVTSLYPQMIDLISEDSVENIFKNEYYQKVKKYISED